MQGIGPLIALTSGQTLKIERVMLYEQERVEELAVLRAKSIKSLGGPSGAVGFAGSPEFVLGGVVAAGVLAAVVGPAMKEKGEAQLAELNAKYLKLLTEGRFFNALDVVNISIPDPKAWHAIETYTERIMFNNQTPMQKRHARFGIEIPTEDVRETARERRYVQLTDDFVTMGTNLGTMHVRWSTVGAYFPIQEAEPTSAIEAAC